VQTRLLKEIARDELEGIEVRDVTDEKLQEVLEFYREPMGGELVDVKRLFRELVCDLGQRDVRERIRTLWSEGLKIREEQYLNGTLTDKQLIKQLVSVLRPVELRRKIEYDLSTERESTKVM
jgi:hypothetical protein